MAGSSIFDYIHSHDRKELAEQLGLCPPKGGSSSTYFANNSSIGSDSSDEGSSTPNPPRSSTPSISERVSVMSPNPSKGYDRCFCIRMKSTLTKRGVHFKSSGYRVVQIVAHLRPQLSFPSSPRKQLASLLGLVGVAIALPPPTITELIIDNDMFVTRLSPQFKVTYCEPRIADMMDVSSEDIVNRNLYEFCHAEDLQKLQKAHVDLLNKGQVLTDYYRLMNRHGGYVWIQTCATIICNAKNVDEQNIIAINYVLSGIEHAGCVMNLEQCRAVSKHDFDGMDADHMKTSSELASPSSRRATTTSELISDATSGGTPRISTAGTGNTRGAGRQSQVIVNHLAPSGTPTPQVDGVDYSNSTTVPVENKPLGSQTLLTGGTASTGRRKATTGGGDEVSSAVDHRAANSRRKADKPRKRKHLSADGSTVESKAAKLEVEGIGASTIDPVCLASTFGMAVEDSPASVGRAGVLLDVRESPLPEDLSTVARSGISSESPAARLPCELTAAAVRPHTRMTSPTAHRVVNSGDAESNDEAADDDDDDDDNVHDAWMLAATEGVPRGTVTSTSPVIIGDVAIENVAVRSPSAAARMRPSYNGDAGSQTASSSVHDLEAVLSKHLPDVSSSSSSVSDVAADQVDHLLYGGIARQSLSVQQQLQQQQQQRSAAIQWIGAAAAAATTNVVPDTTSSALLRSLQQQQQQQQQYPMSNQRESVIRTNAYCSNSSNGTASSSHHHLQQHQQYYAAAASSGIDAQSALLTPPGAADLYRGESASSMAYGLLSSAKSPTGQDGVYSSSGSAAGRASGYGGSDPYAVTPPSSVSPLQQDAYSAVAAQYAIDHALIVDGLYQHHQHQNQHQHHLQTASHLQGHHHQQHQQVSGGNHLAHFGGSSSVYRHQPIKPHAAYVANGSSSVTGSALAYEQSMTSYQQAAAAAAAMAAGYYYPSSPVTGSGGVAGGGTLQAAAAVYGAHYRDAMKHANAW